MPGSHSRNKGARMEREIAQILGAKKVSGMYREGPDLEWRGRYVEVKARANGFREIYKWLDDDASILAFRADRQRWMVAMDVDTFLDLVGE